MCLIGENKMVKKSYKLRGTSTVTIIPISDLHVGSEQFNEDYFEFSLDVIDRVSGEKRIYLAGDLVEAASKHVGNASFKTEMPLDEQIDYVVEKLSPYKNDIVSSCIGNHEARLSKEFDLDVNKIIGRALGIPTGNQFLDVFKINGQDFTVYTAHGKGSSAHFYTAQSKMIRDTQHIMADLLMHGHNHRCGHFTQPILVPTPEGRSKVFRKHYVFTGSYLRYNGYAEAMLLPILPEAFIHLNINKDLRIKSTQYNIDEVKPDMLVI